MKENDLRNLSEKIKPDNSFYNRLENNLLTMSSAKKSAVWYKKSALLVVCIMLIITVITTVVLSLGNKTLTPVVIPSESTQNTISKTLSSTSDIISKYNSETINNNSAESTPSTSETSKEPIGGDGYCVHFENYHFISSTFINYVGQENFNKYLDEKVKVGSSDECPYDHINIYDFISDFKVPRSDFEKLYYPFIYYNTYYNLDILYSGNKGLANSHYKKAELITKIMDGRLGEYDIKVKLAKEYDKTGKYDSVFVGKWSIAEFVYENNITREQMEKVINTVADKAKNNAYSYEIYSYNLDKLYDKDESITDALENVKTGKMYPTEIDEKLRNNNLEVYIENNK